MTVRICHCWSSDTRIPASASFDAPVIARGHEVVHATPRGPHVASAAARGVGYRELPMSRRLDPLGDARGLLRLTRMFTAERFDVVHTHNAKVGIVGRLAATAARVPVLVHTVHGFPFHPERDLAKRLAYQAAERLANVRTDAIFTQSQEDTDTLRSLEVIPDERIVFVGNGIDLQRFAPARFSDESRAATRRALGLGDDAVLFVCASRLRRDKGIVELIEAAISAHGDDPRVVLALAGDPDDDGRMAVDRLLLERARAHGVRVLGHRDDVPALYAAADVVTLPSWHEGLPRALIEGAASGRPLLTTDVPGCREVARAPMVARTVPPRDARALAEAMHSLARDPSLRDRARTVNRAEAERRFDVRQAATRIADTYDQLLARARARGASVGVQR